VLSTDLKARNARCAPPPVFQEGGGAFNRPQSSRRALRAAGFYCAHLVRLEQAQASATGTKKPQADAWGFEVC
jgi:hypothetical protein